MTTINTLGIDCTGLIYYTLTSLGYGTVGFEWNNPVPVDTPHWLSVNENCSITYGGVESKVDVEKKRIKTEERPYWQCADGSTIAAGSVVVAEDPTGIDHAWIYMGEFNSRNDVVSYLKKIGVADSLITTATVGSGNGDGGTHWRIESNGSQGVVINNNTDGKKATALNATAFRITKTDVEFKITKVLSSDKSVKISGTSKVDGTVAKYGVYSDKSCTNKVSEITIGTDGTGSVKLPAGAYFVKEISAPTGYEISTDVYELKANENVFVLEDFKRGKILINKTAADNVIKDVQFKVTGDDGSSYTAKSNANGVVEFDNLKIYNTATGQPIKYTVTELNVPSRYKAPAAQTVTLNNGTANLTTNLKFVNDTHKGSLQISKTAEDGEVGEREFTVTGGGRTYTMKTDSTGVAILSGIPVYDSNNNKIVYTISEKNVPVKYVIPANQTTTLNAESLVAKSFHNELKKFTAEVVKKDRKTEKAQGDATLSGAVYGLYKDGNLLFFLLKKEK